MTTSVPFVFATMPSGTVPASDLDANFNALVAGVNASVQPGVVTASGLTAGANTLLGNSTGVTAAIQGISIGSGLTLSGGVLAATGGGGGSGTVTTVSVVTANGFAGSVATATSTPAITLTTSITGVLKGNGSAISSASAGTDYVAPGGALGTPSSGTLTNCSGLPIAGTTGYGTGVATALAVNVGSAGAFVAFNGALGTPSSGTLTSCTGLPMTTGVTGILAGTNGGTGVNNSTRTITIAGNLATTGAFNTTLAASASITITLPGVAGTLATLAGTEAFTNKTYNGNTWTAGSGVLTLTAGKTATVNNTLTFAGTDGTTMTFPSTSATIARTDAANTFTGVQTMTSPSFTTPVLGTPTSGNLSNCTADGINAVGFLQVPQNSQSSAYGLVLSDGGKHIYHPSADTSARIWTIPANASVAYPIGTTITFVNDTSAGVITIAITTDTLVLAGAGTTGSRTLAASGIATAIKKTATSWMISGTGLT